MFKFILNRIRMFLFQFPLDFHWMGKKIHWKSIGTETLFFFYVPQIKKSVTLEWHKAAFSFFGVDFPLHHWRWWSLNVLSNVNQIKRNLLTEKQVNSAKNIKWLKGIAFLWFKQAAGLTINENWCVQNSKILKKW